VEASLALTPSARSRSRDERRQAGDERTDPDEAEHPDPGRLPDDPDTSADETRQDPAPVHTAAVYPRRSLFSAPFPLAVAWTSVAAIDAWDRCRGFSTVQANVLRLTSSPNFCPNFCPSELI